MKIIFKNWILINVRNMIKFPLHIKSVFINFSIYLFSLYMLYLKILYTWKWKFLLHMLFGWKDRINYIGYIYKYIYIQNENFFKGSLLYNEHLFSLFQIIQHAHKLVIKEFQMSEESEERYVCIELEKRNKRVQETCKIFSLYNKHFVRKYGFDIFIFEQFFFFSKLFFF